MQCPKCGEKMVIVESSSSSRPVTRKVQCPRCGHSEVLNDQGQQLLTEVQPVPSGASELTEG